MYACGSHAHDVLQSVLYWLLVKTQIAETSDNSQETYVRFLSSIMEYFYLPGTDTLKYKTGQCEEPPHVLPTNGGARRRWQWGITEKECEAGSHFLKTNKVGDNHLLSVLCASVTGRASPHSVHAHTRTHKRVHALWSVLMSFLCFFMFKSCKHAPVRVGPTNRHAHGLPPIPSSPLPNTPSRPDRHVTCSIK